MENQSRRIVDFPEQSEVKDGDKLLIDNEESYTHSVPASVFAKAKELSIKQDKLNTAQTNAVNSGITSDKVAQIAQNKTDIAQNKTDIAQNKTDIAQNKKDIAQNKTDIAQNTVDIANLTDNINKVKVTTLPENWGYIMKSGRVCMLTLANANYNSNNQLEYGDTHTICAVPTDYLPLHDVDFLDTYSNGRIKIDKNTGVLSPAPPIPSNASFARGTITYITKS